jgi:hypothetical protein
MRSFPMRCSSTCGVALPVIGLLSAVAMFAAHATTTTGSSLPATPGMVMAAARGVDADLAVTPAKADVPTAVNMNDWQETAVRRGSIRRL